MNLNGKFIIPTDKRRKQDKKDLSNKNKNKLINLILSKKPISLLSNLKYKNMNLSHNIHVSEKKNSIKNFYLLKSKLGTINSANLEQSQVTNFSNYKIYKNKNKIKRENNSSCKNLKKELQNKNLNLAKQYSNEIQNDNISLSKKKKYIIKNQKSESIRKLKIKKSKSISISRNLNKSGCSLERKKIHNKSLLNNRTNCSYNGNIERNKKYLIKIQKNCSNELKYKINLFIEGQRIKNNRKILKISNSHKIINNIQTTENNNKYGNIITNNSDKENTYFTTKKNNLTTNSNNNMPYFTTNFNNSTNITETHNNELPAENKIFKQKKIIKKKLGLPFHPNSKKCEYYNQLEQNNNLLIKNNKSEIFIPYNKKCNNNLRIKRDNSSLYKYKINETKIGINNSARNKNDSFFDLYKSINNNKSNNFVDSFDILQEKNNSNYINNNNVSYKFNEDDLISAEIAHFRIVSFIQESKNMLK